MIVQVLASLVCFSLSHAAPGYLGGGGGYSSAPTAFYASVPVATKSSYTQEIPRGIATAAISYPTPIQSAPAATLFAAPAPVAAPAPHFVAGPAPTVVAARYPGVVSAPAYVAVEATPIAQNLVSEPYDPNPQYSFRYGVADPHTGDLKQAQETLVNGVVHGSYAVLEPDGSIRKVVYTADKINGFNAVVEKKGGPVAGITVAAPAKAVKNEPVAAAISADEPTIAYPSPIHTGKAVAYGKYYHH